MMKAVQSRSTGALAERLRIELNLQPQFTRIFLADTNGKEWAAFPARIKVQQDEASADWYWGVSRDWRPYVSRVYASPEHEHALMTAIAAPILDGDGLPIGIMVIEMSMEQFDTWLETSRVSQDGYLYILDHTGTVVAHPKLPHRGILVDEYRASLPVMRSILDGTFYTGEYVDPWQEEQMIAAFLPLSIGKNRWVIVSQQPVAEAYEALRKIELNIALVGLLLTLVSSMIVAALSMSNVRNAKLNKELQRKNQQLAEAAAIVHSSNDAIIGSTLDGNITTWNTAAERIYGYTADEIIGKPVSLLVPVDRYTEMEEIMEQIMQSKIVRHVDTVRLRKGGQAIDVSLTVSPLKDENDIIIGASSIARDITERKQVEQMRKDVVSIVSHQLKAPVAAIRWMVEAVVDGVFGRVPEKVKQALMDIQDINLRNSHLLADILNVSRIDRGVIKVQVEQATLKEIVDAALHDYLKPFAEKNIKLKVIGKGSIKVFADKDKFAEAVGNAISNALKYTKEGSVTVRMRKDDTHAYIDVTDTGQGMDQATMQKLFTRDKILGDAATAERSAGLGLYISKSFMELQQGTIIVTSKVGKGSTFTYSIPLATAKTKGPVGEA
jgi:PAS domain S-box-containing protein